MKVLFFIMPILSIANCMKYMIAYCYHNKRERVMNIKLRLIEKNDKEESIGRQVSKIQMKKCFIIQLLQKKLILK